MHEILRGTHASGEVQLEAVTTRDQVMQQALRADTLLDSIVIKAFSHDRIEGAWQRLVVIVANCHVNHSAI